MKQKLLLCMIVFDSTLLMAQPIFTSKWTGKEVKNGQPTGFSILLEKGGKLRKVHDLNPNDLFFKGSCCYY